MTALKFRSWTYALLLSSFAAAASAQVAQLSIDTSKIVHPVSPMLYGLMTEEINHSYEGWPVRRTSQQPHIPRELGRRFGMESGA